MVADTERELTRLPVAFTPLSDSDEINIGKNLEHSYSHMWDQYANGAESDSMKNYVQKYVQAVGARVAAHAHRKLPYRIHYIPSLTFINAFALPGGPVFIGAACWR